MYGRLDCYLESGDSEWAICVKGPLREPPRVQGRFECCTEYRRIHRVFETRGCEPIITQNPTTKSAPTLSIRSKPNRFHREHKEPILPVGLFDSSLIFSSCSTRSWILDPGLTICYLFFPCQWYSALDRCQNPRKRGTVETNMYPKTVVMITLFRHLHDSGGEEGRWMSEWNLDGAVPARPRQIPQQIFAQSDPLDLTFSSVWSKRETH